MVNYEKDKDYDDEEIEDECREVCPICKGKLTKYSNLFGECIGCGGKGYEDY